jgi:hypothetical protein
MYRAESKVNASKKYNAISFQTCIEEKKDVRALHVFYENGNFNFLIPLGRSVKDLASSSTSAYAYPVLPQQDIFLFALNTPRQVHKSPSPFGPWLERVSDFASEAQRMQNIYFR